MDERRLTPRLTPSRTRVAYAMPAWPEDSRAVLIHDVSASGLGLLAAHRLDPGGLVLLDLEGAGRAVVRVRHAAQLPDGVWQCGCEMLGGIADCEMRDLLA
jgi:hypothetical protein